MYKGLGGSVQPELQHAADHTSEFVTACLPTLSCSHAAVRATWHSLREDSVAGVFLGREYSAFRTS